MEEEASRSKEDDKKNSKEKANEFFVKLSEAENSKDVAQDEQTFSPKFGLTRAERANGLREKINKNIAAK